MKTLTKINIIPLVISLLFLVWAAGFFIFQATFHIHFLLLAAWLLVIIYFIVSETKAQKELDKKLELRTRAVSQNQKRNKHS